MKKEGRVMVLGSQQSERQGRMRYFFVFVNKIIYYVLMGELDFRIDKIKIIFK